MLAGPEPEVERGTTVAEIGTRNDNTSGLAASKREGQAGDSVVYSLETEPARRTHASPAAAVRLDERQTRPSATLLRLWSPDVRADSADLQLWTQPAKQEGVGPVHEDLNPRRALANGGCDQMQRQ